MSPLIVLVAALASATSYTCPGTPAVWPPVATEIPANARLWVEWPRGDGALPMWPVTVAGEPMEVDVVRRRAAVPGWLQMGHSPESWFVQPTTPLSMGSVARLQLRDDDLMLYEWRVGAADTERPTLRSPPRAAGARTILLDIDDASAVHVEVLVDAGTGRGSQTYPVVVRDGRAELKGNRCYAPFFTGASTGLRVSLRPVDAAGNRGEWVTLLLPPREAGLGTVRGMGGPTTARRRREAGGDAFGTAGTDTLLPPFKGSTPAQTVTGPDGTRWDFLDGLVRMPAGGTAVLFDLSPWSARVTDIAPLANGEAWVVANHRLGKASGGTLVFESSPTVFGIDLDEQGLWVELEGGSVLWDSERDGLR